METIGSFGEFQLIQRFFSPSSETALPPEIAVGPGDDAAVLTIPRTQQLVITTDTLVEGVHFTRHADPFLLGQKALRVSLSDMAAMAGQPRWYLLSLTLPKTTPLSWIEALAHGLNTAAQRPSGNVALIGGNTSMSKEGAHITVTLLGLVGKNRAVTRSGAQIGDHIFVSGTIGDATLGLSIQQGTLTVDDPSARMALQQRHNLPTPPVELAIALQESALTRSAIDISDGLIADLKHLCEASKVGARINAAQIPLSPAAQNQVQCHGKALLSKLLSGGEDYELLFTVAPTAHDTVMTLAKKVGTRVTQIGVITTEPHVILTHHGQTMTAESSGWTHF